MISINEEEKHVSLTISVSGLLVYTTEQWPQAVCLVRIVMGQL